MEAKNKIPKSILFVATIFPPILSKLYTMEQIIILLIIGAVAGWLASKLMKNRSMSLIWTIILGIAGAYIGNIILDFAGIHTSRLLGEILSATFGAVVLLYVAAKIR